MKGTLESIDSRRQGDRQTLAGKAEGIDEFLASFRDAARKVGALSDELNGMVKASGGDFPAAIAGIRQVVDKLNTTFDEPARENLQATVRQLSSSTSKFDKILADLQPVARDLAADTSRAPTTNLGQSLARFNRILSDVGLLTASLRDYDKEGKVRLNANGSIQRLFTSAELYDSVHDVVKGAKSVMGNFNRFASRIADNPAELSRGVLQGR